MKINTIPLVFGFVMAFIDVFMLGLIKSISLDVPRYIRWMIAPTIVYAIQPWIFLNSLKFESLTVMNLLWDLASDILVTMVGLLYFKEQIGPLKLLGVALSLVAMFLMTAADGDSWHMVE